MIETEEPGVDVALLQWFFWKTFAVEENCRAGALQSQPINLVMSSVTEDFPVTPGNGLPCVKPGQGQWGRILGLREMCSPMSTQSLQGEP